MKKRVNTAVWIENRKLWRINVQKDGIRKSFYSSAAGRAGQREANAKADAWLDDNIENPKAKVFVMSGKYLEELKNNTSEEHCRQYDSYFRNWINPHIGTVSLTKLTEQHLQSVINAAHKKGLAKKTLNNIRACLTAFLKFCRKCKVTMLIPENLYIPKGAAVHEKGVLQPEDIRKLFSPENESEIFIFAYRFAVVSGLRPGELIGLKWTDIKDDVLRLRRSINAGGRITSGKNENAQRNFNLTKLQKSILKSQAGLMKSLGIESEYIFAFRSGEATKQNNYSKHWRKFCIRAGLTANITPYELRHTFVSAIKSLPEGYLRRLVGHSADMDTYGVYSHQLGNDMERAATMIDDVFDEILCHPLSAGVD